MELQIQDLVASIKRDGIEEAKKQSDEIISKAHCEADSIVNSAREESKKIISDAEKEVEILKKSALAFAQQAKRDAVLSFESEIRDCYKKILSSKIEKALNDKVLGDLIKAVLSDANPSDYAVQIASVSEDLKSQLANELKNGLEINITKGIGPGFKLAAKDGSGFFDCTEEEIASMLESFIGNLSI